MKHDTIEEFEALVTTLVQSLSHYALYSAQHPAVGSEVREFLARLEIFLARTNAPALFLQVQGGEVYLQGQPLVGATIRGRRLVELVRGNSSGGIVFRRGVGATEILTLYGLYHTGGPPRSLAEAKKLVGRHGLQGVQLVGTDETPEWFGKAVRVDREIEERPETPDAVEVRAAVPLFQDIFEAVEESFGRAAGGDEVDVNAARSLGESLGKAGRDGMHGIMSLAAYPDYDAYTVGHSIRVALLAVCVASRIEERAEVITELGAAALLHDVGKAQIPHEILYKPAALSPEERRIMSKHACLGAHILLGSRDAGMAAIGAAWGHHRRYDRKGYPEGHSWAISSQMTSLLQVCDVFEALTARRPYKAPLSPRRAYEVMLSDEGAFDPAALSTFIRHIGLYPPGYCVLLSDGRPARVSAAGLAIDRPRVRYMDDGAFADLSLPGSTVRVEKLLTENEAITLATASEVASLSSTARAEEAHAEHEHEHDHEEEEPAPDDLRFVLPGPGQHLCVDGCGPDPEE